MSLYLDYVKRYEAERAESTIKILSYLAVLKEWSMQVGKRGGKIWINESGKKRYGKKPGKRDKNEQDQEDSKASRAVVDHVLNKVKNGGILNAGEVKALADNLKVMSFAEVKAMRDALGGVRVGKSKQDAIDGLVVKARSISSQRKADAKKPKVEAKKPESQKPKKNLATPMGRVRDARERVAELSESDLKSLESDLGKLSESDLEGLLKESHIAMYGFDKETYVERLMAYTRAESGFDDGVSPEKRKIVASIAAKMSESTSHVKQLDDLRSKRKSLQNRIVSETDEKALGTLKADMDVICEQEESMLIKVGESGRKALAELIGGVDREEPKFKAVPNGSRIPDAAKRVKPEFFNTPEINQSIDWVRSVVSYSELPDFTLAQSKSGRAFYNAANAVIAIDKESAKTGESPSFVNYTQKNIVHELGHHIEMTKPGCIDRCKIFLKRRSAGEVPQVIGTGVKKEKEIGCQDNFQPVFGDMARYVGRIYERDSTEILSMGIEALWSDPSGFAKKDPEYFQFVLGELLR